MTSKVLSVSQSAEHIALKQFKSALSYPPKSLITVSGCHLKSLGRHSPGQPRRCLCTMSARLMAMHREPVHMSSTRLPLSFLFLQDQLHQCLRILPWYQHMFIYKELKSHELLIPVRCWRGSACPGFYEPS